MQSGTINWTFHPDFPETKEFSRQWNLLASKSELPTIFQTYEWLSTWWRHFSEGRETLLITGKIKGEMVAAAPLMISEKPLLHFRKARILEFIGTGAVVSRGMGLADRMDFLFIKDQNSLLVELIVQITEHVQYDMLLLRAIPVSSKSINVLEKLVKQRDMHWHCTSRSHSPYIEIKESFTEYLNGRSSKIRRKLRNSQRRLTTVSNCRFVDFPDCGFSINELIKNLMTVAEKSKKWHAGTALFQQQPIRAFFKDFLGKAMTQDWLRVRFLFQNDRPQAYQLGFEYCQRRLAYNTAYAEEIDHAHPGINIMLSIIENVFHDRLLEYDMMRGREQYKKNWCTSEREEMHVVTHTRTLIGKQAFLLYIKGKDELKKSPLAQKLYKAVNAKKETSSKS